MIYAFCGQKGGVGKTTSAVNLACELMARGKSVLLVDADPQGTVRTWAAVSAESGHPTPTVVAMGETMHRPDQLPKLAATFDATVIDCPPRHGAIQRSALMVANVAVLPCGPSALDAWALASSLELVTEAQTLRPELRAAVLLTRKQGRTAIGKNARTVVEEGGLPVLESECSYRVAYQEAFAAGLGVTAYAPKDAATSEVRAFVTELERFAQVQSMPHLKAVGDDAQ